jgi:hypothetical protein
MLRSMARRVPYVKYSVSSCMSKNTLSVVPLSLHLPKREPPRRKHSTPETDDSMTSKINQMLSQWRTL